MSKSFLKVLVLTALGVACEVASMTSSAAESASLEALQGKWSAKRAGGDGQTLTLEIDGQKVTFGIAGSDGQTRFVAKGSAKAVQMGPLKVLQVSNIESGRAANELKASNEEYSTVYTFHDGALVMAANFDKAREGQKPEMATYTRVDSGKDAASKLVGNWKLDVEIGETKYDYTLKIAKDGGNLTAALVSPRSGEYKAKKVKFENNGFQMEVDRKLEDNQVTFVYTGKLMGETLSGDFKVEGAGDEFSGTWKAKK